VNGKSIGGSDEIAKLDKEKALADKMKTFGGKWLDVKERFTQRPS
jgi:hypothetical protein